MMNGMTTQERYDDICRISGMSEDIVRRVLNAEKQSICNSLRRGERATLIGRVTIRPELRQRICIGGETQGYVKLKATVSSALASEFETVKEFMGEPSEETGIPEDSGIVLRQIPSLI